MRTRSTLFHAALWMPLMLSQGSSQAAPAEPAKGQTEAEMQVLANSMREGVEALYVKNQPAQAVVMFRDVLAKMPTHYGANYQLAVALDAVGDPEKAKLQWEKVIKSAQAIGDHPTTEAARKRFVAAGWAVKMQNGLQLLYDRQQPAAAAKVFREILAELPTHYGASFHLARAVERTERPDVAIESWNKVLKMAQDYSDKPTEELVRQAIAALKVAPIMTQGLTELYERHQPEEAAKQFRSVLKLMPTHYGATYQLAVALDEAKRPEEARPLWTKALEMARSYRDDPVAVTATARLAH